MKIKFLKPFRLYNPIGDDMMMDEGTIENMEKEDYAQWLIDNGFAEEVKESGWWRPKYGERYYYIGEYGRIKVGTWNDCLWDERLYAMCNVFKTEEATDRFVVYLKAITTVRQDEGVLTPEKVRETLNQDGTVYTVGTNATALSVKHFYNASAGAVYFDTLYNANTSIGNHPDEWKIIVNYDWSRE